MVLTIQFIENKLALNVSDAYQFHFVKVPEQNVLNISPIKTYRVICKKQNHL